MSSIFIPSFLHPDLTFRYKTWIPSPSAEVHSNSASSSISSILPLNSERIDPSRRLCLQLLHSLERLRLPIPFTDLFRVWPTFTTFRHPQIQIHNVYPRCRALCSLQMRLLRPWHRPMPALRTHRPSHPGACCPSGAFLHLPPRLRISLLLQLHPNRFVFTSPLHILHGDLHNLLHQLFLPAPLWGCCRRNRHPRVAESV